METAQSLTSIDCCTDLAVSILNGVSLCTDSIEKDLLQDVVFRSVSGQELSRNKTRAPPSGALYARGK